MRIEFDAGNAGELAAVAALIASLRGESAAPAPAIVAAPPAPPVAAAEPVADPVQAFAGAADAEQAFAAPPIAAAPPPAAEPSVPAAAASPGAIDLDGDGLPYDARIHSKPPSKKKDGKWRQKRGVAAALVVQVEAELRQAMAAPAAVPVAQGGAPAADMSQALEQSRAHLGTAEAPPAAPLPPAAGAPAPAPTAPPAAAAAPASSEAPPAAPPAPPVAAAAPPAPPAPPSPVSDFTGLMRVVTQRQTAGTLTVQQTSEIATSLGLSGLRDLMNRPDLIASFVALLPPEA